MFVYQVTNKINGKRYIGQHVGEDLLLYWSKTTYFALHGYQGKRLLYRAIRKYGVSNFEIKPLVIVGTKEELDLYERGLIKAFETMNPGKGYNITAGGGGSFGVVPDEETRAKMSKSRTGLKMPDSHKQKLSERSIGNKYALGRKMTADNHAKLMATHVGAKRSEESKQRMSQAHIGKKLSEETKQKMKEAQQRRREREASLAV